MPGPRELERLRFFDTKGGCDTCACLADWRALLSIIAMSRGSLSQLSERVMLASLARLLHVVLYPIAVW